MLPVLILKAMQEYSPQAAYDFSEIGKQFFDQIANLEDTGYCCN